MATNNALFFEGQSVTRPPMFNGINFISWRDRMKIFLQSIDIDLWYVVNEGPFEASIIDDHTNRRREKTRNELTPQGKANLTLNAKAMNVLYNALDANESTRVKGCSSAKEIWDKLKEIHEGSDDVREQKKSLLVAKYESFKMEPHENIDKMYCRFNDIIKDLEALGKEYSLGEKNRKILNALSKEWDAKTITIEEAKNLNLMPIESLINSLTSYELKLKAKVVNDEEARPRRSIALKTSQEEDENSSINLEDEDLDEGDLALITKGFLKHYINKRRMRRGGATNSNNFKGKSRLEMKKQNEKYFECGQLGHITNECPTKKKKEGRKLRFNNFQITWAQMAFMAIGDDEVFNITNNAKWFIDSGCSRHMTGDASLFTNLTSKNSEKVTFGDNNKAKSIGIGDVGILKEFEKLVIHEDHQDITSSVDVNNHQIDDEKNEDAQNDLPKAWRFVSNYPQDLIIGDLSDGVTTRSHKPLNSNCVLLSHIEPKHIDVVLSDESWVNAMQDELNI
ncbi:hypothetical protein ACH5RR_021710 [Cinchona calisaya]|uniref:Retrovirus-related Pol polyprotein from transposon TNT 1-94-like beta-barrel domain-containing protein n=1 Tax=Cinchona calisaya TaxID=153742 RepID=A0ABD2ZI46_9GENT